VLVNTTNSCHMDVQEYWIDNKSVSNLLEVQVATHA
jgi:hypothetical protein